MKSKWPKRIQSLLSFFFSAAVIGAVSFVLLLLYLRSQPLPHAHTSLTTQIYDAAGGAIVKMYRGENRQIVPLEGMSPYVIQATLAVEDHRFFRHFGFDLQGLARAVLVNVSEMAKVQGGSTITQQLARNLYLSHEKTWTRKIKEAIYTLQLEMQYDKEEILEQYLNEIYYGHAAYGIQSASRLYFHKDARDLSLAESALLAGVPKGPRYFSPYYDEQNAKKRQKIVLDAMVREGFITAEQAEEAYRAPLALMPLTDEEPEKAPYFRDYVIAKAADLLRVEETQIKEGGYRIYTTLDMRAQEIAEDVVRKTLRDTELETALVAIDPRNGHVKAMVGGKDYAQNQYNRVFAATRQPGSSFKPVLYLTALMNSGFTAVTQFKSEPTVFTYDSGKTYAPSNFGNRYPHDYIDLRRAIKESDNIYAVNTIMQVGADKVIDTARKLGIEAPMSPVPSLALGTYPVSPFAMASAFATIANQGVRVEPVAILKIEDARGRVLYEAKPKAERVIEAKYTYVLTKLMESVFEPGGTGYRAASTLKRPVAGKTGTTDSDAWMVGFTPELAVAVWVGYDRGRQIGPGESHLALPIFAEFTERTLAPIPPKIFPIPEGVVNLYIDPETGKLATENCPNARLEAFVRGTEPTEYCDAHAQSPASDELPAPPPTETDRSWWEDFKRWWNE